MTLTHFVAKSAFRNKRRSLLTVASIAFSLLLLCIMLCVWRSFYIDKGAPDSALRIMTRHKVSLANFLPIYYREKIRAVPGVVHVVPMTWLGAKYKDDKPENFFAQFATDPDEYSRSPPTKSCPPTSSPPGSATVPAVSSTLNLPGNTTGKSATTSSCRQHLPY